MMDTWLSGWTHEHLTSCTCIGLRVVNVHVSVREWHLSMHQFGGNNYKCITCISFIMHTHWSASANKGKNYKRIGFTTTMNVNALGV